VVLWHVSLLWPGETTGDGGGCSQVEPEIGITSTPLSDRARGPNGAMYIIAHGISCIPAWGLRPASNGGTATTSRFSGVRET
jgi:hypothetical protein